MIQSNQIWKIYGTTFREMTLKLLKETDLEALIRGKTGAGTDPGSIRIGIKPNLVCPTPSSFGATTHTEILEGIIEYLQGRGYSDIVIAEGSWVGDRTSEAYEYCGYRSLCEKYGVPFVDAQKEKPHEVDAAGMKLNITDIADTFDFLINVPVLKGHCQTRVTCALKNMKGLLPNTEKRRFHQMGLHKPIAHLSTVLKPDFSVFDHICGDYDFEEGGNPVLLNCIMAALDPVLTDSYACRIIGYTADDVPYIRLAEQLGTGTADLDALEIVHLGGSREESTGVYEDDERPREHKVLSVKYAVDEADSCSACYANLVPALMQLEEEGLLEKLPEKIAIGQGHQGRRGTLGIGRCTKDYDFCVMGCPPDTEKIYGELKKYIEEHSA